MKKTRKCWKCGEVKELLTDFGVDKTRTKNRSYVCKKCDAGRTQEKYVKNRNTVLTRYKKYYKANRQRYIERNREVEKTQKHKARYLLRMAVASGEITKKGCVICGRSPSEGHHFDYKKPFDIIWLCRLHHGQIHRKYTGGLGDWFTSSLSSRDEIWRKRIEKLRMDKNCRIPLMDEDWFKGKNKCEVHNAVLDTLLAVEGDLTK